MCQPKDIRQVQHRNALELLGDGVVLVRLGDVDSDVYTHQC
jgi:hypothetical protein